MPRATAAAVTAAGAHRACAGAMASRWSTSRTLSGWIRALSAAMLMATQCRPVRRPSRSASMTGSLPRARFVGGFSGRYAVSKPAWGGPQRETGTDLGGGDPLRWAGHRVFREREDLLGAEPDSSGHGWVVPS